MPTFVETGTRPWALINLDLVARVEHVGGATYQCFAVDGSPLGKVIVAPSPGTIIPDNTGSFLVIFWRGSERPERAPINAWSIDSHGTATPVTPAQGVANDSNADSFSLSGPRTAGRR